MRRFPWFELTSFAFGVAYFFAMSHGRALWGAHERSQLFWFAPIWCGVALAVVCRVFKNWFAFSYGAAFFTGFVAALLATPVAFVGAYDFTLGSRAGGDVAVMGVFAMVFIWCEPLHYVLAPILGVVLHRISLAPPRGRANGPRA